MFFLKIKNKNLDVSTCFYTIKVLSVSIQNIELRLKRTLLIHD